jgi:hypothetical protein
MHWIDGRSYEKARWSTPPRRALAPWINALPTAVVCSLCQFRISL